MSLQDMIHNAMLRQGPTGEDAHLEAAYEDQHGYPEDDFDDEPLFVYEEDE